ncbi:MAG: helix-turn-helix transcriptional regulator [Syntrophomonadaceae bacterium]|nr:helix-turn-helix transcriptional regulator [Syntrophomonadaceae bacterium]
MKEKNSQFIRKIFAERLLALREERELTQKELGALVGYTDAAIGNWERAKRLPDPETLAKLADIFDVTTDYLLGRDREKPEKKGKIKPGDMIPAAGNEGVEIDMYKLQEIVENTVQKILERRKREGGRSRRKP